ncbi:uncharacterized LabA/DUF88 family protein [Plasticicumulans acidivorans]|uniref:Uncharacterized LabA/DUF88 family protein n=1 Tax=Plasticicumulans acidivorans TaxID=886464 RepID=A0A317MXD5_9GAMM|nr:uncharacterized LabA/DUF88 family protein [Plasticicumulans acidivorans]
MDGARACPRRLALLIDAENVHETGCLRGLFAALARHGDVRIRRAYGDWSGERLRHWREYLAQHAIQAVQVFPTVNSKNAADIALVIDAMDVLHAGRVDGFCLLASDSDYTRLAVRLREAGQFVLVAGRDNTPQALRKAADLFLAIEPLDDTPRVAVPVPTTDVVAEVKGDIKSAALLQRDPLPLLHKALQDGSWVALSSLGQVLRKLEPGFDVAHYGFSTLTALVCACEQTVERRTESGGHLSVRLRGRQGDAAMLLRQALTPGVWLTLSAVGIALRKVDPAFNVKRYGHAQLQKLLLAHPQLIECRRAVDSGAVQQIRLRA